MQVPQLVPSCVRTRFGFRLNYYKLIIVAIDRILSQPVEIAIPMGTSPCGNVSAIDLNGVTQISLAFLC